MSTYNQALRKPLAKSSVIKEVVLDATTFVVGDNDTGITVPAGALIKGVYLTNTANDLASGGSATLAGKVGSTTIQSATGYATLKGSGVGTASSTFIASSASLYVTVATAVLTAGTVGVKVEYTQA